MRAREERTARKRFEFAGGFPVEGGLWLASPWGQPRELAPGELARAERSLAALPADEAKGMARLIARMKSGRLEPFAAEDGYSREVRRLAGELEPALAPLLEAVAWSTLHQPSRALPWLRGMQAYGREMASLVGENALEALTLLFRLNELGREAGFLARDLLDPRLRAHPLFGGGQRATTAAIAIRRALDSLEPLAPPNVVATPHHLLARWVPVLSSLSAEERRAALVLHQLVDLGACADAQAQRWKRLRTIEQVAKHARGPFTDPERERLGALADEADTLARGWPDVNLGSLLEAMQGAARRPGAARLIFGVF